MIQREKKVVIATEFQLTHKKSGQDLRYKHKVADMNPLVRYCSSNDSLTHARPFPDFSSFLRFNALDRALKNSTYTTSQGLNFTVHPLLAKKLCE